MYENDYNEVTVPDYHDAAGNRIEDKRNGITKATYEYDAFNLLTYSQQYDTGNQILFRYGIDNQRYLKIEQSVNAHNSKTIDEVTLYAGPQFEAIRNDREGVSESKIHVTPYLTVTRKDDQTIRRHFKFQDRLGSTTLITKENGEKVKTLSYDAFGKPRNGEDWTALSNPVLDFQDSSLTADITKRGFTDHEHLDNFELIHMNGRMYDFNNGRFLSVDPFIQGTDSQAINPYSYIQNNPLSGVDPTGYLACLGDRLTCKEGNPWDLSGEGNNNIRGGGTIHNGKGSQGSRLKSTSNIVELGDIKVTGDSNSTNGQYGEFNHNPNDRKRIFEEYGFHGGLLFLSNSFQHSSLDDVANIDELRAAYFNDLYGVNGDYWRYKSAGYAGLLSITAKGAQAGKAVVGELGNVRVATKSSDEILYSPLNKGPLKNDVAVTFRSYTYAEKVLKQDTVLYRVISENGNPTGGYWTRVKPQGPLQSVIDSALDQNWGNTATRVVTARVPAGTKIYEGAAAQQRGLVGGGNQIYIPKVDRSWIQ